MIADKEVNNHHYSPRHAEVARLRGELENKAASGEVMKRENISSESVGLLTGFSQLSRDGMQEYGLTFVMSGVGEKKGENFSILLTRPDQSTSIDVVGAWYDKGMRRRLLKDWYRQFPRYALGGEWERATQIYMETAFAMGALPLGESDTYPVGMYFLEEEEGSQVQKGLGVLRKTFRRIQSSTAVSEEYPFGQVSGFDETESFLYGLYGFIQTCEPDLIRQTPLESPDEILGKSAVTHEMLVD